MKSIRYIIFILILLAPYKVKAECSFPELSELQKIASNVNFSYDYYYKVESGINSEVRFKLTIANLNPNIYIYDVDKLENYRYTDKITIEKNNYVPGGAYQFRIYSNKPACKGRLVLTTYVTFPKYNRFSEDDICNDIEDYYLCNKWQLLNISYQEFKNKIEEYKNVPEVEKEIIVLEEAWYEVILEYIYDYYLYVLISTIIVCSTLIFLLRRNENKKYK